jgi:pilus assembly protein Flp/PilA
LFSVLINLLATNPALMSSSHRRGRIRAGDREARVRLLAKFLGDESGATAIEYCLIACGIAFAIIAIVQGIGPTLGTKFTAVNSSLK